MSISQRDSIVNKENYVEGSNGLYRNYKAKHKEVEQYFRTYDNDRQNIIWWTHILYDNAYEYLEENHIEKYTVVIPCYAKPKDTDELTIKDIKSKNVFDLVRQNSKEHEFYNVCFVIAQSQEHLFKEALKEFNHTTYIALPDDQVQNIGMKRQKIVELFRHKKIFMLDDDTSKHCIDYRDTFYRKDNGEAYQKSKPIVTKMNQNNYARSLAVFQLLAEETFEQDEKCLLCLPANNIALLNEKVSYDYKSATISGCPCQFFIVNCERLLNNGLNFGDSREVGHEDLDLAIKMLQNGFIYRMIGGITFNVNALINPKLENNNAHGYKNIVERFETYYDIMYNKYKDIEWVNFVREEKDKGNLFEGRGVPNIKINIRRWKSLNNIIDTDYEHLDVCSKYVNMFISSNN